MASRTQSLAIVLIITIFLACGLLYTLNISQAIKEGFENSSPALEASYNKLQSKLQSTLQPYCSLADFVQDQMKTMYMTAKVSESGESVPGDSDSQAAAHIQKAYQDAYACKDELASSRQTCKGNNVKMDFISCSVYMNTPSYDGSDLTSATIAISQIPDNLALRIAKEVDWYSAIIKKLQSGLDAGAHPPTELPKGAPGADYKAPIEGFESTIVKKVKRILNLDKKVCSADAAREKRERERRKRLEKESNNCTIQDLQTEINRVNKILNSDALKSAVSNCAAVAAAGQKLQSQLALLKAGTLYDWQKSDGATKSYAEFKGGDRIAALTFSIQQNRG